ncbi:TIGR04222 domain-containing membrane protein [Kitasatospora sp. NPDC059795]|uniref:TIGR04222 domain-containing membrane protein n=1 Tax=Kitasatospora sp. NPDC059795 TaxID=3346949 RepID=UPI00364C12DA
MWNTQFVVALALVASAVAVATVFNRRCRRVTEPKGLPGRGMLLLEAAYLAGGPARAVDTALVRMEREGRVVISRAHRVTVTDSEPRDAVESVLITAVGGRTGRDLSVLRTSVVGSPDVQRIGDPLAARGLLRRPTAIRAAWRARRLVVLALVVTLALGTAATLQWLSGPARDSSAPPFFPFGALAMIAALYLVIGRPPKAPITPAGLRQLRLVRGTTPWRPRDVSGEHAALVGAFALDGAAALTDEEHLLREAFGGAVAWPVRLTKAGRRSVGSLAGGSAAAGNAWCGAASYACGSSSNHSGGHSGGGHSGGGHSHSCGSSSGGDSGGHSGGHSCGGSSHSCGSSSSCGSSGSSCGGGGGCGS